jgi:hypothetical protein
VEETLSNIRFIPSEAIAQDPTLWRIIARRIEVTAGPLIEIKSPREADPGPHDRVLALEAQALHARLMERSRLKLA